MIVAVHQPQYLPWPGLFDKMARADLFVFLDNVQFVPREWQNRNRIRTWQGWQWLTVPVHGGGRPLIRDVRIDTSRGWAERHLRTLEANYKRCPGYPEVMGWLEPLLRRPWSHLWELNVAVTRAMARALDIATPTRVASDLGPLPTGADHRILAICEAVGAHTYLAGAGGRNYMDPGRYEAAGVRVEFQAFTPPVYPQVQGEPIPGLSAIDLLFQRGLETPERSAA
ncbi:WbqC family protein [Deferrisoma palaeochoriense]